jgi:hypothetical protein
MTISHGGHTMDQIEKDDQIVKNTDFLKGMLAAFVDIVVEECSAEPRTSAQTDLVLGIREELLGMMKRRLFATQECDPANCEPPRRCEGGICMDEDNANAFTWPE